MKPPAGILAKFVATDPVLIAETGIATIWRVRHAGGLAALKIYADQNPQDEWPGFALLHALDGAGAVRVIGYDDGAALMEWLDGPSLGDLTRSGHDDQATREIARVVGQMHNAAPAVSLPTLHDRFSALRVLKIAASWPASARINLTRCQSLASELLANQCEIRPLHGDLHHDNIKMGARGYVAFDAKGVMGDRAYDLANVFQNPIDILDIVDDPARIMRLAAILGQALDITPKRLLSWAAAHSALSMAWGSDILGNPHLALLGTLLDALDAQT